MHPWKTLRMQKGLSTSSPGPRQPNGTIWHGSRRGVRSLWMGKTHGAAGSKGDGLPGGWHLGDPWRWQSGRQDETRQPPEAPQAASPVVSSPLSLQGTGALNQLATAPGGRGVFGATGASEKEGILPHQLTAGSCQSYRRRISCSRKLTLA